MLKGTTMPVLAKQVEETQKMKRDFPALTTAVEMFSFGGSDPMLKGLTERPLVLNETAQRQLAEWTGMKWGYWQQCWGSQPSLLTQNVNTWFQHNDARRLFRCYDDPNGSARLRAFLSEQYQRIDNYDLLQLVIPQIMDVPGLEWKATHLTDDRLYLKVFNNRNVIEPKKGDVLQTGLLIQNEETGLGSLTICPMTLRLVCTNGMKHMEYGTRIAHKKSGFGDERILTDEAKKAVDRARALQIRDTITDIIKGDWAKRVQAQLAAAMGLEFDNPPKDAERELEKYELPKSYEEGVLTQFFRQGEPTMYGLINAVTHVAHTGEVDFEKSTSLEGLGGRMLADIKA